MANPGQNIAPLEYYPMRASPSGKCVIFNFERFLNERQREGSSVDVESLKELFQDHLGFRVEGLDHLSESSLEKSQCYSHGKFTVKGLRDFLLHPPLLNDENDSQIRNPQFSTI